MLRWVVLALGVLLASACAGADDGGEVADPGAVRIGAFDFAESELLAELYAQVLEANGVPVDRFGVVGPREIVAPALQVGELDLVPEYLGTAAAHYGAESTDLDGLRAALDATGLIALEPADARNVNVFVVTQSTAEQFGLTRLSDLAEHAPSLRFGGPVECPERPLCLIGLRDTYGAEFAEFVPQRSLARTADALQRDEIGVGLLFSTSAVLADGPFVPLEDDRALQPAENVVPVIRRSTLERWAPETGAALDGLSARLTTDELREMNRRVEDDEPIAAVAAEWLAREGLDRR